MIFERIISKYLLVTGKQDLNTFVYAQDSRRMLPSLLLLDKEMDSNGLGESLTIYIIISVSCLILSWITKEYSWVDRVWSITPIIYSWVFTLSTLLMDNNDREGEQDDDNDVFVLKESRNFIISLFITSWGLRLSYNFWRKGGYNWKNPEAEDYRWKVLKEQIIPDDGVSWQLFNIIFICFYQNFLLWIIVLPQWYRTTSKAKNDDTILPRDYISFILFIGAFLLETVADEQQWTFQKDKKEYKKIVKSKGNDDASISSRMFNSSHLTDLKNGFLTHGLFSYSRHPNFLGEQLIWLSVWSFSIEYFSFYPFFNIKIGNTLGIFLLTLLFQGSTRFTEKISVDKYGSGYEAYQNRVGMLLPKFGCMLPTKLVKSLEETSKTK